MALVDHNSESEFPASRDKVFDAVCTAIPRIKGLAIATADKFQGRILVKGSISLASWGENIPIQLTEINEQRTKVSITSTPKTGIMLGGANDMGKNRKNIEQILQTTSQILQNGQMDQQHTQTFGSPDYKLPLSAGQPFQSSKKKMSSGKKILIGIAAFILLGMLLHTTDDKRNDTASVSSAADNSGSDGTAVTTGIGDVLHTTYFDVTANKVSIKNAVNTGNQFADLKAEQGNKYLVINATFKNTDKESRMIMDGSVFINYNGKDYKFDKSEVVMLEGWGTLLDQINPLISKTTNLVYKIPAEIKGQALWNPGRSERDQVINLGEIN